MQITLSFDPANDADLRQAEAVMRCVVGETVTVTGSTAAVVFVPPAPAVPVPLVPAAGESAAPLAEPDPAALFTAGAGTSTTAPAAPLATSAPTAPAAPVAPLVSAVPVPPAPAAPLSPAGSVELDAEGIPWDGRIHASTKTKNANGKWKGLRGLNDEAKVNRIKAELLAAQAAPPAASPAPAPAAAVPVPPAAVPVPPAPAFPAVPGAVPAVPGVLVVAAGTAPTGDIEVTTFPQIMKKISSLRVGAHPRMTQEELTAIITAVGLTALPSLSTRPDLIPDVNAQIDALMMTKLQ